jgi:hypothetical protein
VRTQADLIQRRAPDPASSRKSIRSGVEGPGALAALIALFGARSSGARSSSAGSVPVRSDSEDLHSASRSA